MSKKVKNSLIDDGLEKEFAELKKSLSDHAGKKDLIKIEKAWELAKLAHSDQKRMAGEPFVSHPLEVAKILAEWKLDSTSIIAGLLHDTVEDGGATQEDIQKEFGREVSMLVDGVTKVTCLRLKGSRETNFVENLRKLILVMAKDLRVVLVKLADRLHNMRTIEALPKEKQRENAQETLEIYAPLAERLGIGEVKGELEDLSFPCVYPDEYRKVKKESKLFYKKAELHIKKMKRAIMLGLAKEGIKAEVHARKKHLYSLWRKLERKGIDWDFNEIKDIVALRIIVNSVPQCYKSLGLIHGLYKPVPHIGITDFIAQPKPNSYRSIHTKVFGPEGRMVEVQIRTQQMHQQAEFGVAAHYGYSEAKSKGAKDAVLEAEGIKTPEEKLAWIKELVKWQNEFTDSKDFLEAVKFDALGHRNFIFSPNGDVYDLPAGATPIDFAYTVHTDLGNYIKCARVNGKISPLSRKLVSGDIVEIVKVKSPRKPNKDWLDFVKTTIARREIKKRLRK